MSYVSDNKKNFKIKNISFMSPITRTKLNISNLIAETQRIITNSNTNKNTQVQNSEINSPKINYNLNKENQFITDLYRSFSSNRPNIISNKQKENKINSNNQIIKKNISNKNQFIKIKKNSPSPSAMLTKFANFAEKLNKNKNLINNYSFIGKNNNNNNNININKRNQKSNIDIRNLKKSNLTTTNNSLTNIFKTNNDNKNINNISFLNQTQNLNSEQIKKKCNKKIIEESNLSNENNNDNSFNFPLSQKSNNSNYQYNNNYVQQIFKREENDKNDNRNIKNNNIKNIQTQSHQSEISQNFITTNQSTIKKKIFNSRNSSLNEGNIYNKNKSENLNNILFNLNIDSPEELHFFYVNILHGGRELENKFELINSINP